MTFVEPNSSTTDYLTVCAIQPNPRSDEESPEQAIENVIQLMKRAAKQEQQTTQTKIDLFVLPELSPIGYSEDTFANLLPTANKSLYQKLDDSMKQTAIDLNTHVCYGTIGHDFPSPSILTIRQVVVNPQGHIQAVYDKMYPCDFGGCRETRFFVPSPSQQPVSFSIHNFNIGLMICADHRVPTLCRAYIKPPHSVDLILQPAAFYRDITFVSWKSFRETRAMENSVYVLGVNYAGKGYGETTLVPPWVDEDHPPTSLRCEEGWLMAKIDKSVLNQVRTDFPFYKIAQQEELPLWLPTYDISKIYTNDEESEEQVQACRCSTPWANN